MRILVTGAGGQTGKDVINAFIKKGIDVCAVVHRESQAEQMSEMGVKRAVVGGYDGSDTPPKCVRWSGRRIFYLFCGKSERTQNGQLAIDISKEMKLRHFIYHSVLHSLLLEMPHHKQKNQVENALVNSGLDYTVIQPAVLMQNLQISLEQIKYSVSHLESTSCFKVYAKDNPFFLKNISKRFQSRAYSVELH